MDELEVTAEALRKLFEATEKATEGMDGAAEALEKAGEKGEKATEALEKFTESFNEVTELLKGAAEAMDAFIESIGSSSLVAALTGLFSTIAEGQEEAHKPFKVLTGEDRARTQRELKFETGKLAGIKEEEEEAGAMFADGPRGKRKDGIRKLDNGPMKADLVVLEFKKESAVEKQREKLRDERMDGELRVAKLQMRLAKTGEEREKATTRFKHAEQQKQLNDLRKTAAQEQKIHEMKMQAVAKIGEATTQVGEVMAEGIKKQRDGHRGAIAEMLADFLKGVAKKHTILAVAEAAMALGSLAMFNFPGAAGHAASAVAHGAVAGLAGAGGAAMSAIAKSQQGGEKGEAPTGPGELPSGQSPSPSGGGDEGQEAPVTQEQGRRGNPSARPSGGTTITINNPHIYAAGGIKEFAAKLRIELERQDRAGRKPRL